MSAQLTLAIDASTYRGSVAVIAGERLLAVAEVAMRGEREERLMPAVAAALGDAGVAVSDLTHVIAGAGPGSFTSLRIGVAIAKGICTAAKIPLAAVPSLALLAGGAEPALPDGRYLAVLDAMRGDMYASIVGVTGGIVDSIGVASLVARTAISALAARHGAALVGSGESIDATPRARGVLRIEGALIVPVSLESWEPDYGRLAEAQVKWEAAHGRSLASG